MNRNALPLSESIVYALRSLYDQHGYSRYKMNKFEEYDLYARNKDFLISEGVITFTDTNGKLMALKPDVTLSIVKNTRDGGTVQKLYYNENVYRVSKGTHSFREIMQVGLEAIGEIDDYCIFEVLKLATESLACTGKRCVLEVSHLGLLSELFDYAGVPETERSNLLHSIGEKNAHELCAACKALGVSEEKLTLLKETAGLCGTPDAVLPRLRAMISGAVKEETLSCFEKIVSALQNVCGRELLQVDFSTVNDMNYYNGFVFKGFAEGLPSSILSGGQYDMLMEKMKRRSGAIGFAVYLDLLEQFSEVPEPYDADYLFLYDGQTDFAEMERQIAEKTGDGKRIQTQRVIPEGLQYQYLIDMRKQRGENQ